MPTIEPLVATKLFAYATKINERSSRGDECMFGFCMRKVIYI